MTRRAAKILRRRRRKAKKKRERKGWRVILRRVDFDPDEVATKDFRPDQRRNMILFVMGVCADPDATVIRTERVVVP